ncbi:hypothetical protein [Arthrobacter sp.]|uniref:hypothetical protein n=1 Tax=Arthrobacter sp. TaxID=1667 RepID=UPI002582A104|nr:hypothetical protein [Arthrobacter sp.]
MTEYDKANDHPSGEPPAEGTVPVADVPATDASEGADATLETQISAADFDFAEPELGEARISAEAADSVDLKKVEAEAAEVEREAARSTQLGAAEVISSVPPAAVDFDMPKSGHGRDTDETAVTHDAGHPPSAAASPSAPPVPEADVPAAAEEPAAAKAPAAAEHPDTPGAGPHRVGRGIDDGSGWRRPETPWERPTTQWQQSATPWQPKANAWQSPAQHAQGEADAAAASLAAGEQVTGAPAGEQASGEQSADAPPPVRPGVPPIPPMPGQTGSGQTASNQSWNQAPAPDAGKQQGNKGKLLIVLGVVVVGLILVALLIWLLLGLFSGNSAAGSPTAVAGATSAASTNPDDVIVPRASPEDWLTGDCLRGYVGINQAADVVVCSSLHSAQVVGSSVLAESTAFPGDDVLKAKAAAVCKAVQYTDATKAYKGLKEFKAYPSESTWDTANDRRIDCIVVDPTGDHLKTSLIQ